MGVIGKARLNYKVTYLQSATADNRAYLLGHDCACPRVSQRILPIAYSILSVYKCKKATFDLSSCSTKLPSQRFLRSNAPKREVYLVASIGAYGLATSDHAQNVIGNKLDLLLKLAHTCAHNKKNFDLTFYLCYIVFLILQCFRKIYIFYILTC